MTANPADPGGAQAWAVPFDEAGDLVRAAAQRMALARITSIILGTSAILLLLLAPRLSFGNYGDVLSLIGVAAASVWVLLGINGARHGRRVREAAALANVGRNDLAEGRARESLESFCLLRPVTVGAAAVLARVRHGQGRHLEAARLASFVLGRRERVLGGEKRGVRLLLAEALLAAGDPYGAQTAITPLYYAQHDKEGRLTLPEAMRLLAIQLTVDARLGRWDALRAQIPKALPMVELMPTPECVRLTAILARAAAGGGEAYAPWAAFLSRRVSLLTDPGAIEKVEPSLAGAREEDQ